MLRKLLGRNWTNALSEVFLSLLGTVGVVLAVALIIASQKANPDVVGTFLGYFSGGQLSLSILALSGIVFLAIRRHGRTNQLVSVALYVFFVGPAFAAAVMVGLNPGFMPFALSETNLSILWLSYVVLHLVWLATMLFDPTIPTAEEAGNEQDQRVQGIKGRATERG